MPKKYVIFRGKRAEVIGYEDGKFLILDHNDARFKVPSSQLRFIKTPIT